MDSAEFDLNNTLLSSSSISSTDSDDYDKGKSIYSIVFLRQLVSFFFTELRLAAELGRCLLERNHELQNYINLLQKQFDDKQSDMKVNRNVV